MVWLTLTLRKDAEFSWETEKPLFFFFFFSSHFRRIFGRESSPEDWNRPNGVDKHKTAAMEGQEGTQQPHLVLAHKLFLLTHPDVDDIEKVRLRDEVKTAVIADGKFSRFDSMKFLFFFNFFYFIIFFYFLYRYGTFVSNPSSEWRLGFWSESVGFHVCQYWEGARYSRREVREVFLFINLLVKTSRDFFLKDIYV